MTQATPYEPIILAEEIGRILESDRALGDRLKDTVSRLRRAMAVDACSLYRRAQTTGDLYLESTDGLDPARIGSLMLERGEGLAGLVVETKKPLAVRDGPSHPSFRYLPDIMEEKLHSFLGVPLLQNRRAVGGLIVQTAQPRDFSREDIALLNTVARQIAGHVAESFRQIESKGSSEKAAPRVATAPVLRGRSLAGGFYVGAPFVLADALDLEHVVTPPSEGAEEETKALRRAAAIVLRQLERDAKAISGSDGHGVLMAHKVILQDEELTRETVGHIERGASAAEAVRKTAVRWTTILESHADPAFAARSLDFRDMAYRLLQALGVRALMTDPGQGQGVALARSILPVDMLRLGPERMGAMIITDEGIFSHTAILARSFGIPAVQLDASHLDRLLRAKRVLVDGTEGLLLLDPSSEEERKHRERTEGRMQIPTDGTNAAEPLITPDGLRVQIGINAGLLSEFQSIDSLRIDDVGLYRTEIPFMSRPVMPGFKAQYNHYRKVIELARGRPVTFRTFDFGGDKAPASLHFERESNPMMGMRSTRFMLAHQELFRVQLRALLAASAAGPSRLLLPMISTPEELNLALDEINSVKILLDQTAIAFDRNIPTGVMLEVPSVMFAIDELSRLADFFCVGANDFTQYLLAADRSNPRVSRLYEWHRPAVLTALDHLLRECRRNNRPVTMCGEMANNPWAAMVLVGLGYDHLSIDVNSVPLISWVLRNASGQGTRRLAQAAMKATSATEVIELFYGSLGELAGENEALGRFLSAALERLRAQGLW